MKSEIKTGISVIESFVGYGASEYIPTNVLFKKWNKAVAGASVVILGAVIKNKKVGNHMVAVGLGATLNGILDAVGFAKY